MNLETFPNPKSDPKPSPPLAPQGSPGVIGAQTDWLMQVRNVLRLEGESILKMISHVGAEFNEALNLLSQCPGKVVLTGVGKSGLIARKIAATFNSTGTAAAFLHPSDAMHGDLGLLSSDDIVIAIGKSGESEELVKLLPAVKRLGVKVLAITSAKNSSLAKESDLVLYCPVDKEACPLDLAPTSSTTVALAVGDALAVTLMKMKNFRSEDFAKFHPGGTLGKRLLTRVRDLMVPLDTSTTLDLQKATMQDVVASLCKSHLGIAVFVSANSAKLDGIFTDGDIRSLLKEHGTKMLELSLPDVLNRKPITVGPDLMAVEALKFMENRKSPLNVAPVVDNQNVVLGILRIHDLL